MFRNLAISINTRHNLIQVLNERSVTDGGRFAVLRYCGFAVIFILTCGTSAMWVAVYENYWARLSVKKVSAVLQFFFLSSASYLFIF